MNFDISEMSGLLNTSLSGSTSNLPDSSGRSFASSFSGQSGAVSPAFHHTGGIQGLQNYHGNYNVHNMPGALGSRTTTINNIPSSGVQQPAGNIAGGRFASNNLPAALSQISQGSAHGHSGITSRGGMGVVGNPAYNSSTKGAGGPIPGMISTSGAIANRNSIPGLGAQILGNTGSRITSSVGNIGGGSVGRSMGAGGGLSTPRINLASNSGSGNINIQGSNRLMSGVLPQGSPQMMSMLNNSYTGSGGPLSQNHVQAVNNMSSMGLMNDVNPNDAPFDINDFPQLSSHPNSAGGPQGQLGSMRKQGLNPLVQQNQDFSIQNEDFPALPGFKGGNTEYGMDLQQKEQLHDNGVSMMQPHQFSMGRSSGFNLGGTYSSHRQQQPQNAPSVSNSGVSFANMNNQDLVHLRGSDMFPSSQSYHQQPSAHPGIGLRPLNSPSSVSGMGSYDQLMQQYQQQQQQNQPQFRLQHMSSVNQPFRDQSVKNTQATTTVMPDRYGLIGLLSVIRNNDPDLTSLALGIDLTTLGLNLNSAENLYKTFGSPFSDEAAKGDPEFTVPQCYYAKQPPPLSQAYFSRFQLDTLFYIFYSMPKEEAQLFAANELYNRRWFYHKDHKLWFMKVSNVEPLAKSTLHERGSFICFDPNTWETIHKDNFVMHYDKLEARPNLAQQQQQQQL